MKAIIILALVACVAARSVDIDTLRFLNKEKTLWNKEDLLLKERTFPLGWSKPMKSLLNNNYGYEYPTYPSVYGGGDIVEPTYFPYYHRRVTVMPLEEIISHPLFAEYYNIPLFRQFWEEYPVVFRRYVASPLFQQFWHLPTFKTYFYNPVLFYKYIVPQIQVISQYTHYYPRHQETYESEYGYDYPETYGVRRPIVDREVVLGEYLNRIYRHVPVFGRQQFNQYPVNQFYPFAREYTQERYPFSNVFGRNYPIVNHKYLLDKMYKTLFVQPITRDVTEVVTDVKVAPAQKEVVVEPLTGERRVVVEAPRIVDVNVAEKVVPEYETEKQIIKEVILKRLLVTRRITPDLYVLLKNLPLHHVKEIVRRIVHPSLVEKYFGDETTYPIHQFPTFDYNNVEEHIYRPRVHEIIRNLYENELLGERHFTPVRDLLKVIGHHYPTVVPTVDDIRF